MEGLFAVHAGGLLHAHLRGAGHNGVRRGGGNSRLGKTRRTWTETPVRGRRTAPHPFTGGRSRRPMNWPIGLSTGCFHQTRLVDCLETIRESGFSMIEVVFAPEHLNYREMKDVREAALHIEALGMEAYSFHAPFADDIDISSPDLARREYATDEILRAVEAAAVLGVHYVVIHPGPEHTDIPSRDERVVRIENVAAVLNRVAARCTELGIRCALENKLPHLLFGSPSDLLWILAALETNEVGACLDTGHAFLSGDLYALVYKMAPYLRLLHVHDNKGHADDHLAPGDGRIDWTALFKELAAVRFHGALMLEISGAGDAASVMARARRGRSYLRGRARRLTLSAPTTVPHV
ncbi:MAG: sugar phosphate isomerase/epimerase [Chthoniobacterales bacterium]|nr:sugar phosphate isomerase/epimerase [Chthoniobacterales bacterium]